MFLLKGIITAEPITEEEVRGLFNLWNDALATKDPEKVAKRYSKEGVLLPTVSDVPRTDFPGIVDYFTNFLKLEPQGKIESGKIIIGTNWAQDAGIYEWVWSMSDQPLEIMPRSHSCPCPGSPWGRQVPRSRDGTRSST